MASSVRSGRLRALRGVLCGVWERPYLRGTGTWTPDAQPGSRAWAVARGNGRGHGPIVRQWQSGQARRGSIPERRWRLGRHGSPGAGWRSGACPGATERVLGTGTRRRAAVGPRPEAGGLLADWAQRPGLALEKPGSGLRFAFYGRVSTEDWQDPVTSQARQRAQADALVCGHGRVVAEFFDAGQSRTVAWARRPQA